MAQSQVICLSSLTHINGARSQDMSRRSFSLKLQFTEGPFWVALQWSLLQPFFVGIHLFTKTGNSSHMNIAGSHFARWIGFIFCCAGIPVGAHCYDKPSIMQWFSLCIPENPSVVETTHPAGGMRPFDAGVFAKMGRTPNQRFITSTTILTVCSWGDIGCASRSAFFSPICVSA